MAAELVDNASVRAAMGPRRLEILRLIWRDELRVGEIAEHFPISLAAVSQHLATLREGGLVRVRAEGRSRFYRADTGAMGPLADVIEAMWEPRVPTPPPQVDAPLAPAPRPPPALPQSAPAPPRAPSPRRTDSVDDEMTSWYGQGLRARLVALEAARKAIDAGADAGVASARRIATSLTRSAIAERFPDLGASAHEVSRCEEDALRTGLDRLIGALKRAGSRDDSRIVKVLLIEDSRVEALLHRRFVGGPNREVLLAGSGKDAEAILDSTDVDLVLLDLGLPGQDGFDLLIELRRRPRTAAVPVVVLTGRTDAAARAEALSLGADDYYTKPVDGTVLGAAVAMLLERAAEARHAGRRDALTGLKNRAVFLDDLRQTAANSARAGAPLTLAIIDIHRLGAINDFHGNEAGDLVVRAMAECLQRTFRTSDPVARWDGGKFAVALPGTDLAGAQTALAKLRGVTDEAAVTVSPGRSVVPAWDAGVASITAHNKVEEAVARATRRLQAARRAPARAVVASEHASVDVQRRVLLIEDDQILADLIEHRLRRAGFDVDHFGDGAAALAALGGASASAVVLDTMLPGVEGLEILRRLRASPSYAGVPVIVLTFGAQQETSRAFSLGASDALAKPFAVEELVARVTRLVAESEGAQSI